jgi:UrcA family protein
MRRNLTIIALASAASLGWAVAAHAADPDDIVSIRVSYADLDLHTGPGAEALLLRIQSAAKTICGVEPDQPLDAGPYRRCVRTTVDRAVVKLRSPTVTALNDGVLRPAAVKLAAAGR